jgi:hypothetical protein
MTQKYKNLVYARFKTLGQTNMDSYNKRIVLFVLYVVKVTCAVRQVYKDTIKPDISPCLKTLRRKMKP